MLTSNAVTENTPSVLPDGRILYTRWEYNDRSQLCYHHLWTVNPDGSGQMTYFGNMYPQGMHSNLASRSGNKVTYQNVPGAVAMLDAKPIPGERSIVSIFSPGHGRREHQGFVTIVDPRPRPGRPTLRPPHPSRGRLARSVSDRARPFPRRQGRELHLMTTAGKTRLLFSLTHADPR